MTAAGPETLEELIRQIGDVWPERHVPREGAVPYYLEFLKTANHILQARSPDSRGEISEKSILAMYRRSPHKISAFLQALAETDSADMLVMAWRILEGVEIAQLQLSYLRQEEFLLRVELRSDPPEIYESKDVHDTAILRHLVVMIVNGKPIYDGFFALNR